MSRILKRMGRVSVEFVNPKRNPMRAGTKVSDAALAVEELLGMSLVAFSYGIEHGERVMRVEWIVGSVEGDRIPSVATEERLRNLFECDPD